MKIRIQRRTNLGRNLEDHYIYAGRVPRRTTAIVRMALMFQKIFGYLTFTGMALLSAALTLAHHQQKTRSINANPKFT